MKAQVIYELIISAFYEMQFFQYHYIKLSDEITNKILFEYTDT